MERTHRGYFDLPYRLLPTSGANAAALQALIEQESSPTTAREIHVGAGTLTLSTHSAAGILSNPTLIGYAGGGLGAGKKVTLRGSGMNETTLVAGIDATNTMRFVSNAAPIVVTITDMTLDFGALTSVSPMIFIQNAIYFFQRVRFKGADDLSKASGIGGNGTNRGVVADCEFICMAKYGINLGAGQTGGGRVPPTEDNRQWDHAFIRNRFDNFGLHAINCHTARSVLVAHNKARLDMARFGAISSGVCYRAGNGGERFVGIGNDGEGCRAMYQINDYAQVSITGGVGRNFWGPAIVIGQKNNIEGRSVEVVDVNIENVGRLLGRAVPVTTGGDGDEDDDLNVFSAQSAITVYGGNVGNVHGGVISSDVQGLGLGRVIAVKGSDTLTFVDDAWRGKSQSGPSFQTRGNILYVNGFTLGRISTASDAFGDRQFYNGLNGGGSPIGPPIPYGITAMGAAVEGGSMVMTVKLDAGAAFSVGNIADLGNVSLQAGSAWTFTHLLEEYIRTGKRKDAPTSDSDTWAWVPLNDPLYFIPGPAGSTISLTQGSTTITGSSSPAALLSTTLSSHLAGGVPIDIHVKVAGRWAFGCTLASAGSETVATAYSNSDPAVGPIIDGAVRTISNAEWAWAAKKKMRSGGYIGYHNPTRNGARNWRYDRSMAIEGYYGSRFRLYYVSMAPDGFPSVRRTVGAFSGSSTVDIDDFLPPEIASSQALWRWKIKILTAATGTISLRLRWDNGVGSRTTLKTVDISALAVGTHEFAWAEPLNDMLPDGNSFDPTNGGFLALEAVPTGAATVGITMHEYAIGPW